MHEIITLQFGNQSNYIGTHFWNAQESYFTYSQNEDSPVDHDVHFRPGIGSDGSETFTPRVLVYDVKENFGTLRQVNALYDIQHQDDVPGAWSNDPIIRQQPTIPQHPYQLALEAGHPLPAIHAPSVRFWSDFNHVFYHPRSMVQLNLPTSHLTPNTNSEVRPLDQWTVGEELFKTEDQEHDLLDRDLRLFVEESDQLQGFQALTGGDDAWAGFAGKYVERLKDEYGRKSIWAWGSESKAQSANREKKIHQAINSAKATSLLSEQATLYMPILNSSWSTLPAYATMDPTVAWQTSALQAFALESVTLPTRLAERNGIVRGFMGDIEQGFTNEVKRNVLRLSMSVSKPEDDVPMINGDSAQDHRMVNGFGHEHGEPAQPQPLDIDLFKHSFGQAAQSLNRRHFRRDHVFAECLSTRGMTSSSENDRRPDVESQAYHSSLLAPRPSSFPHIFSFTGLDSHASVATKTKLTASTDIAERYRALADIVRSSPGVLVDDREGLRADLLRKAEDYVEGFEESDTDGDDD